MTNRTTLVNEVESALNRSPKKSESGRYAVYVPGAVVIGTYDKKTKARDVATTAPVHDPCSCSALCKKTLILTRSQK